MNRFELVPYTESLKKDWDDFVERSKNGTFLFKRDYMEYHSDRFEDNSILFYEGEKLKALFPACRRGDILNSHAGLTYGGFVTDRKNTVGEMLLFFDLLKDYCRNESFKEIIYKPVPYIYHKLPADEDLYALFRNAARLIARGVSSVIEFSERIKFRDIRKSGIRKAKKAGLIFSETTDLDSFWEILNANLKNKYSVTPVHSLEEMKYLANLFPDNIRLFGVFNDNKMLGGTLCYFTPDCVHSQYISASPEGKEKGALDLLFSELLDSFESSYKFFDFGISTEEGGKILNENLIYQKEGFGGRAVCYDTYQLSI